MQIAICAIRTHSGLDVHFELLCSTIQKIDGHTSTLHFYPSWLQFVPWLLWFIRVPKVDLVISNLEYGCFLKRKKSILWVVVQQCVFDPVYKNTRSLSQKIFHTCLLLPHSRRTLKKADQVIAASESVKALTRKHVGEREIAVIYNGIDTDLFKNYEQRKVDKAQCTLLYVGNLHPRKGIDLLPKIADALGDGYRIQYTIGKRMTNIPAYLEHPNLECIGSLTHEELVNAYNNADIFLFPTRHEGFGYVVAEAMVCGLPCIVSNNSSMPELIEDGVNGILCTTDDISSFAKAIEKLWQNSELR